MTEEATPASALAVSTPVRGWRAAFPPARWLSANRSQWLPRDAIGGVTLAAYGIRVPLAYASVAGLPPVLLKPLRVTFVVGMTIVKVLLVDIVPVLFGP